MFIDLSYIAVQLSNLNCRDALFVYFKNDFFLRTLFFGIYLKFNQNNQTEISAEFPLIKNAKEPEYRLKVEIDPVKDEYDLVNISAEGILNEKRNFSIWQQKMR